MYNIDSYDNEAFVPIEKGERWQSYNANPKNKRVGDCTVRAISAALGQDWYETYIDLCLKGFKMNDMPSADVVWGEYLKDKGFKRSIVPCEDGLCMTIEDFCKSHPHGVYVLCPQSHVVAAIDGCYLDTWQSGDEIVLYYWQKRED